MKLPATGLLEGRSANNHFRASINLSGKLPEATSCASLTKIIGPIAP
jgi:hypothetical protein